MQLIFQRET